jgi:hypothetical protein
MLQRVAWGPGNSPFDRGSTRPLKLTLHDSSLVNLSEGEVFGLAVICELARLPMFELVRTLPGTDGFRQIEIPTSREELFLRDRLQEADRCRSNAQMLVRMAGASAVDTSGATDDAYHDLLVAAAHRSYGRDVLVTKSRWVTDSRSEGLEANPRSILETLKLMGLLLRSRDSYVYGVDAGNGRWGLDRHGFFLVLERCHLPHIWRFLSIAMESEPIRKDDTSAVASSVSMRCRRALQAHDRLAENFYARQEGNVRDDTLYHFDYLTLLLHGALEAQALVVHRAYGVALKERNASFFNGSFLEKLELKGGGNICQLVRSEHIESFLEILREVRNTIHRASIESWGYSVPSDRGVGRIRVADRDRAALLWDAATVLGGPEAWGLSKDRWLSHESTPEECTMLELCACADSLVRWTLKVVDAVAERAEVERLLAGHPRTAPWRLDSAPTTDLYEPGIVRRVALLGA